MVMLVPDRGSFRASSPIVNVKLTSASNALAAAEVRGALHLQAQERPRRCRQAVRVRDSRTKLDRILILTAPIHAAAGEHFLGGSAVRGIDRPEGLHESHESRRNWKDSARLLSLMTKPFSSRSRYLQCSANKVELIPRQVHSLLHPNSGLEQNPGSALACPADGASHGMIRNQES
ncbi:MAG TPA: hypothetical protein VJV22_05875 [Acidobacteriaceae bacterium]|nr:hypothetical protein [Acidobacteriaceae bacterium]